MTTLTTDDLAQIKRDITARKAMPGFGAGTSLERLRIINSTQRSFSLETVEALVEALEKEKGYASAYEAEKWHYHGLAESEGERANQSEARLEAAEKCIAELQRDSRESENTITNLINRTASAEWACVEATRILDSGERQAVSKAIALLRNFGVAAEGNTNANNN